MDNMHFDKLTKMLATNTSRRQMLRGALGGAVAAALALRGRGAQAAPNACAVFCADQPGPRKAACKQACRVCNKEPERVCRNFETGQFTCCPEGDICADGICCASFEQLCFGPEGATCCEEGTFCDFETGTCGPPAICGPESGCLGGTCAVGCFCVSSVEGDGACVSGEFANCDAQTCVTSADCAGGTCVDATDCCGFPVMVCFPPEAICSADGAGAGARTTAAAGWRR